MQFSGKGKMKFMKWQSKQATDNDDDGYHNVLGQQQSSFIRSNMQNPHVKTNGSYPDAFHIQIAIHFCCRLDDKMSRPNEFQHISCCCQIFAEKCICLLMNEEERGGSLAHTSEWHVNIAYGSKNARYAYRMF